MWAVDNVMFPLPFVCFLFCQAYIELKLECQEKTSKAALFSSKHAEKEPRLLGDIAKCHQRMGSSEICR